MRKIERALALAIVLASFTTSVFGQPATADLSVDKTGPAVAPPGTSVTYTITLTNNGPSTALNVSLTDNIPADMTFFSGGQIAGSPSFSCNTPPIGNGGTITCTAAAFAPGTVTFQFTFDVAANALGVHTNTATVTSDTADPNPGNQSDGADTNVASSDITTSKSGPASALADTDVSYTVTITNLGPSDAPNAKLVDQMPNGMTFVSVAQDSGPTFSCDPAPDPQNFNRLACTLALMPAGSTASFTFVFHIPPATSNGTDFTNIATGNADFNFNEENDQSFATTSTPPLPSAEVSVLKTGPGAAAPDSNVSYTITVTNNGPDTAQNVTLTDELQMGVAFVSITQDTGPTFSCGTTSPPSGDVVTCTIASFPVGTATFTLVAHVPASSPGSEVTNFVEVTTTTDDPSGENNSSSTTLILSSVDVEVTKTGPAGPVNAGTDISYTITVINHGPDVATDVTLFDPLPPNTTFVSLVQDTGPVATCGTPLPGNPGSVSCNIPPLGDEQSAQFTLTIRVGNTTSITNTATGSTSGFDTDGTNNDDSVTTTATPVADVRVTKSGLGTVTAGSMFTYTIAVTNDGPSDAANVQLSDTLPGNATLVSMTQTAGPAFNCTGTSCNIAILPPATTASFSLTVMLASNAANGSVVTNTANVSTTTSDPNANNSSTVNSTVTVSADVAIVKTAPSAAAAGTDFTYTITVTNTGPSDATAVSLSDNLPSVVTVVSASQTSGPSFTCTFPPNGTTGLVTCSIPTLVAGASGVFTIVVHLSPAVPDGTIVTNTANIFSTSADPSSANNTSTANTTVGAAADLSVTKTGPTSAVPNQTITYTVTVANAGPADAVNVTLTDNVPAGTGFLSAAQNSGPPFTCTTPRVGATTGAISCTIASFANGATAQFSFTFYVLNGTTAPISNTATITSPTDSSPGNNASTPASAVVAGAAGAPTLSEWGLLALALALIAIVFLRLQ